MLSIQNAAFVCIAQTVRSKWTDSVVCFILVYFVKHTKCSVQLILFCLFCTCLKRQSMETKQLPIPFDFTFINKKF